MANEKRLVNAETIARKLKNAHCAECNVVRQIQCSACWVNDVLELLEGEDVDAVEVVHGRWLYSEENECLICSNCEMSALNNYRGNSAHSDYCPNCGADMRGKE